MESSAPPRGPMTRKLPPPPPPPPPPPLPLLTTATTIPQHRAPPPLSGFLFPPIAGPRYPSPPVFPFPARLLHEAAVRMDLERTRDLVQFMASEGLEPTPEEERKRKDVMEQLKQIIFGWVRKVARKRHIPKEQISSTTATILAYGSYGLGVYGSDSDIDALCVGPYFATLEEDFFIVLRSMLLSRPEVSDIHCVKSAKVPLMRFKFNGISVDFPYAQLCARSVPDDVDLFSPHLAVADETSWRSLSGVLVNKRILQLLPHLKRQATSSCFVTFDSAKMDLSLDIELQAPRASGLLSLLYLELFRSIYDKYNENFQSMLRCIKLWARRRGVYSHLLGFFGGIHLAILAAYVCQRFPNGSINALVTFFFENFSLWPWPKPVILQDSSIPFRHPDGRSLMPIMMPCSPFGWCNSNITKSTCSKIKEELHRGYMITRDSGRADFEWSCLFEPFPYTETYSSFVRIFLSAPDDDELGVWVGWVKSRFLSLLLKLESVQGYCDPNPTEYVDRSVSDPNVVFCWGLSPNGSNLTDIISVKEDFMRSVNKDIFSDSKSNRCKLELLIVESSQLPESLQLGPGTSRGSKASWRVSEYNQQQRPIYSQYFSQYFVGYVASQRDYDGAVG